MLLIEGTASLALYHLIIIALVQGITEFLPISSSAHLILLPQLTGLPDQGPVIDVAVHVGTLAAVMLYFRSEVAAMTRGGWAIVTRNDSDEARPERMLTWAVVIATIPVVIVGFIIAQTDTLDALRNVILIGWTTLIFGIILWAADRFGPQTQTLTGLRLNQAVMIGLAQAISLIPGTSRAGITITAARALGFAREDAARFSMLLAIPTIAAAGVLTTLSVLEDGNLALGLDALIAGALAFVSAYLAIGFFLRWARRATMTPFVIYRVILGVGLLLVGYGLVTV